MENYGDVFFSCLIRSSFINITNKAWSILFLSGLLSSEMIDNLYTVWIGGMVLYQGTVPGSAAITPQCKQNRTNKCIADIVKVQ